MFVQHIYLEQELMEQTHINARLELMADPSQVTPVNFPLTGWISFK